MAVDNLGDLSFVHSQGRIPGSQEDLDLATDQQIPVCPDDVAGLCDL